MPNVFLALPVGCVVLLILPYVLDYLEDRLIYRDGGYGVARRKFNDDARARGLTWREAQDELRLREEMARVRRESSDSVRAGVGNWLGSIEIARSEAIERLAQTRPDLARRFTDATVGLSFGHILYPAEAKMVDQYSPRPVSTVWPTEDQRAALRIVRP